MPVNATSNLRSTCTKFLSYDPPSTAREALLELADYAGNVEMDQTGAGVLVERLEGHLSQILGKEAVLFMPSGKAGQNILLRLWCESKGIHRVAMHPRSHLQEWEENAYAHLFGLESVDLGASDRQVSITDLEALNEEVGVVTVELALRPLGCEVMRLDDLARLQQECCRRNVPFHGDCARIWESQPYYGRPIAEIANYFDSLYVSLYKGVGGLAGAAIAGPSELIAKARVWQIRMGQKLYRQFPYLLAALQGLERRLPQMAEFHAKALHFAHTFREFEGIQTQPVEPQTNAFIVHFPVGNGKYMEARNLVAQQTGLWLFDYMPTGKRNLAAFEVHIWEGGLRVSQKELKDAFTLFLQHIEVDDGV